jgi:Helix-turn-helix domain
MFLFDVVTPAEIEKMFDLPTGSVRRDINRNKFRKSEIRKSGSTWLITKREAKRVYKGELAMIRVMDDWTWVNNHVDEELENETLFDDVNEYMQKHNIDVDRIKELYHDGLSNGIEDGKYLPFAQWFYEFSDEWE